MGVSLLIWHRLVCLMGIAGVGSILFTNSVLFFVPLYLPGYVS